mmetsp:Transcript_3138/g.6886  ORF Transcript_3138/g.6886 Transcript_3138/m.6886 type:complete len:495 (-) Transcript_3138:885-2369(-)|eukprot:CAMPEP_0202910436 /NCGR_PEP_ID=MMETSP1392-20130828/52074_1 /ASSEMBLY_ACC=CAM_ASM_000868 /TAXON_ID=225041 /ORGANISM="Chlamydomonas chlamydogama, Strain SAG 11-48b" /LENGTH=494 /DNA_ID=CAMNT_0049600555 /DNA_START=158 /DNA_END=1642 /DNA_ORIENTATION=-
MDSLMGMLQGLALTGAADWTSLPPNVVEKVALYFALNGDSLLALGGTCKFWHDVATDRFLWRKLVVLRFGPDVLPKETLMPEKVDGWVFVQGFESPGHDFKEILDLSGNIKELVAEAEQHPEVVAFGTRGVLKYDIKLPSAWTYTSYEPGHGMYIRQDRLQAGALPNPPSGACTGPEPPQFPGWVFYRGLLSHGGDLTAQTNTHGEHHHAAGDCFIDYYRSLQELHSAASINPNCEAFDTMGHLKYALRPFEEWSATGSTFHGTYVKAAAVDSNPLPAPPEDIHPRNIYQDLAKTRLGISRDADVVWLDGRYLDRITTPGSLSRDVVKLNDVCWLDVTAVFRGLPAGKYTLVWRLGLWRNFSTFVNFSAHIRKSRDITVQEAAAQPAAAQEEPQEQQQQLPRSLLRPPQLPSELEGAMAIHEADNFPVQVTQQGWEALARRHSTLKRFFELEVGTFELPGPATAAHDVVVKLFNYDNWWKSGLLMDCVEVRRLE